MAVSQHETDYSAGLEASYELDFWGKERDVLDSAAGRGLRPDRADRATVALTATSAVSQHYFQLLSCRGAHRCGERAKSQIVEDILNVVQRG